MSIKLSLLSNNNLLTLSNWTVGTGGVTGFAANGDANESQRLYDTGPWGSSVLVWQSNPSGNGNADGGWEGSNFNIDSTKLYRYSVWVRRTSSTSGGTFYFGLHSNGTGDVYSLSDGSSQTNPYFDYRGTGWFNQNQWFLVVGHVYPAGYSGTKAHPDSGFYNVSGGKVAQNSGNIPFDCRWGTGATQAMNRTYHYYCGDNTTHLQFFSPRVELVDGNEPPINSLITQNLVDPTTLPQAVVFSDGTRQTTAFSGKSEVGALISVQAFTNNGTWYRPAGCNKVVVKVAGGGGGGSGYCESGGAGGYAEGTFDVKGVSSVAVTIGGGGSSITYYAAAGNGGTSSFGSYISASGGNGANVNYSHSGGHGGVGSGGQLNTQGGAGTGHVNSAGSWSGGRGGQSYFGGSSLFPRNHGNLSASYIGKPTPAAPGAGGPGAQTDAATAGGNIGYAGEAGIVIIYSYK